jgi:hypothetical protein
VITVRQSAPKADHCHISVMRALGATRVPTHAGLAFHVFGRDDPLTKAGQGKIGYFTRPTLGKLPFRRRRGSGDITTNGQLRS